MITSGAAIGSLLAKHLLLPGLKPIGCCLCLVNIDKHHSLRAGLSLQPAPEEVVRAVSEAFNCDQGRILTKGLMRNAACDANIYIARDLTSKSNVDLGDY